MSAAYPRAVRHFGAAMLEGAVPPREGPRAAAPPRGEVIGLACPPPRTRRIVVRLWLPSTALFLLLAPFALLLTPLAYLAPRPYRVPPFAAVFAIGRLLLSLGGTVVHVDTPETHVSLRLF